MPSMLSSEELRRHSPERISKLIDAYEGDKAARNKSPKNGRWLASPPRAVPTLSATPRPRWGNAARALSRGRSGAKSEKAVVHPPLLSLEFQAQKLSAEEVNALAENRRKAHMRLIEKRRQLKKEETLRAEADRQLLNSYRTRWREGFKDKRRGQLETDIDKCVLQNTLANEPNVLRELLMHSNDDAWSALMTDLATKDPADTSQTDLYAELARAGPAALQSDGQSKLLTAAQVFLMKTCEGHASGDDGDVQSWRSSPRTIRRQESSSSGGTHGATGSAPTWQQEDNDDDDTTGTDVSSSHQLADCVFLAGPRTEDIENILATERAKAAEGKPGTSEISYGPMNPSMLFVSKRDKDTHYDSLAWFCFPKGVTASVNRLRSLPTSPLKSPGKTQQRRSIAAITAHSVAKFVFTQQTGVGSFKYGVCLVVPRTYRDYEANISVTSDYCLCIMTTSPFFQFCFHALMQFEACGGLELNDKEPLRAQEESFPVQTELRMLNDFAVRLKRLKLPLYPTPVARPPSDSASDGLPDEADDSSTRMSLYLPPATLTIAVPRQQRKIKLVLPRNLMQQYFRRDFPASGTSTVPNRAPFLPFQKPQEAPPPPGGRSRSETRLDLSAPKSAPPAPPASALAPASASADAPTSVDWDDINEALLESERDSESCFHILLWSLPILLKHLSLENIVMVIGCALTEMKVIVCASDRTVVSGCLLALVHLLRPLKWAANIVINVPRHLEALSESPSPIILGMPELPEGFKEKDGDDVLQGFVVVDPELGMVNLNKTDAVASHTLTLPQRTKLEAALKGYYDTIKNFSRAKRKATKVPGSLTTSSFYKSSNAFMSTSQASIVSVASSVFATGARAKQSFTKALSVSGSLGSLDSIIDAVLVNDSSPHRTAGTPPPAAPALSSPTQPQPTTTNSVATSSTAPALALPVELDPSSAAARQLYTAVAGFRATMMAHLQALVNTAVQSAWDGKRAKRKAAMDPAGASGLAQPTGFSASAKIPNKSAPPIPAPSSKDNQNRAKQFASSMYVGGTSGAGAAAAAAKAASAQSSRDLPRSHSLVPSAFHTAPSLQDGLLDGIREIEGQDYADSPLNSPANAVSSAGRPHSLSQSERVLSRPRGAPSADTINEDNNSVDESVSSCSSLPRVQRNQVLLAAKDLGEPGMRFVKRLSETQAFSNYCHTKSQEGKRTRTRAFVDLRETLPLDASPNTRAAAAVAAAAAAFAPADENNGVRGGGGGPKSRADSDDAAQPQSKVRGGHTSNPRYEEVRSWTNDDGIDGIDGSKSPCPLTDLFSIMMTGSLPMSRDKVDSLRLAYDLNAFQNQQEQREKASWLHADLSDCGDVERAILWCNGRCGGLASSPTCTSICLSMWGGLVQTARHQHAVRALVTRHQQDGVLKTAGRALGKKERLQLARVCEGLAEGPKPAQRQGKETASQYALRVSLLHKDASDPLDGGAGGGAGEAATGGGASAHMPSAAVLALTRFHSSRKARSIRRVEFSAVTQRVGVLSRFFARARFVLASRKARISAIRIQALARGYILRLNAAQLFSILQQRNVNRDAACQRLQLWWRRLPDSAHASRRSALAIRRRSFVDHIPLPVGSPGVRQSPKLPLSKALSVVGLMPPMLQGQQQQLGAHSLQEERDEGLVSSPAAAGLGTIASASASASASAGSSNRSRTFSGGSSAGSPHTRTGPLLSHAQAFAQAQAQAQTHTQQPSSRGSSPLTVAGLAEAAAADRRRQRAGSGLIEEAGGGATTGAAVHQSHPVSSSSSASSDVDFATSALTVETTSVARSVSSSPAPSPRAGRGGGSGSGSGGGDGFAAPPPPTLPTLLIAPLSEVNPKPSQGQQGSSTSRPDLSLSATGLAAARRPSVGGDDEENSRRPMSARAATAPAPISSTSSWPTDSPRDSSILGRTASAGPGPGPGPGAGVAASHHHQHSLSSGLHSPEERRSANSANKGHGSGLPVTPVTPTPNPTTTTATSTALPAAHANVQVQPQAQPQAQAQAQLLQSQVQTQTKGPLSLGTPYPRGPHSLGSDTDNSHSQLRSINRDDSYDVLPTFGLDDDESVVSQSGRPDHGGGGSSGGRARFQSTDSISGTRPRSESSASDYGVSEKASEADRLFLSGTLSTVGLDGNDSFTPQQREILFAMWTALRSGVEVRKHGLTGQPRQRYLYCDAALKCLFWREQGGKPDAELDAEFARSTGAIPRASGIASWASLGRADSDRFLVFKDVLQVREDLNTVVMQRSKSKKFIAEPLRGQPSSVISLVCRDRTLDFELDPALWSKLFHALQILTNHYQRVVD